MLLGHTQVEMECKIYPNSKLMSLPEFVTFEVGGWLKQMMIKIDMEEWG